MLQSLAIAIVVVWFMYLLFGKKESGVQYYNGPKPTEEERRKGLEWMADHIRQFPSTSTELKKAYPELMNEDGTVREFRALSQYNIIEVETTLPPGNNLKNTFATAPSAEGSYTRMLQQLQALWIELREMPDAFDTVTGKINEQNREAVEIHQQIVRLERALKTADKSLGMDHGKFGN